MSDIVDPAHSVKDITDLCVQYFRAGCQDIVSDIVDPAASLLDFYLPLYSNSSILGQDVLDIVSDIVDPAASMLLAIPVFSSRMSWTLYPTS